MHDYILQALHITYQFFFIFFPISVLIEFTEQVTNEIYISDLIRPTDLQVRKHMGRPKGQMLHLTGILYDSSFFP